MIDQVQTTRLANGLTILTEQCRACARIAWNLGAGADRGTKRRL